MIGIELSTAVETAVMARDGSRRGDEIRFRCPFPEKHRNGDQRPSADYNVKKKVWKCRVCHADGGCIDLARLIGVPLPSVGINGTGRDRWPSLPPEIRTTWKRSDGAEGTLAAYWTYRTRDGKRILGYTARYDYPRKPGDTKPPKDVVPYFQKHATGDWKPGAPKAPRSLFGLDSLTADPDAPAWIPEGEKCTEELHRRGASATTWQGGSESVLKAEWSVLEGRSDVRIWPDNDGTGRDAARKLLQHLLSLKNPPKIRVLNIDALDLPEGGDVVDWWEKKPQAALSELESYLVDADAWLANSVGSVGKSEEWESPEPLEGPEPPPFPVDVLSVPLRPWVQAEAEATQTPQDLAAMTSIGTCAAALAKKVEVKISEDWREPLNLYVAVAIESGNRKSAVFDDATTPLRDYERAEAERLAPLIREYLSRIRTLEARRDHLEKRGAKEDAHAERDRFLHEAIATAEEMALLPQVYGPKLIVDDCTAERLASILSEQGGRIASMSAEGGVFDLMRGRYSKNGLPQFEVYLKGHAGDEIRVDRGSRPPDYVRRPAITMVVTVQPEVICGIASEKQFRGRGLLARYQYSVPRSLLGSRKVNPSPMPPAVRKAYNDMVTRLCRLPAAGMDRGSFLPHLIRLHPRASQLLDDFRSSVEPGLAWGGKLDSIKDWASKLPGAVVRLAAILHMVAHAEKKEPWKLGISAETMAAAIAIGNYLVPHAFIALGMMGAVEEIENARSILGWIKRNQKRVFSKRDAHVDLSHRFRRAEEIDKPLLLLASRHVIRPRTAEPDPGKPGRRPSPMFDVNPAVWSQQIPTPQECQQKQQNSARADAEGNSVGSVGSSEASQDSSCAHLDEEVEWTG